MPDFLSETLKTIMDTAVKAAGANNKVSILKTPTGPEHIFFTVNEKGELEEHEAQAMPRKHRLDTLAAAIYYAQEKCNHDSAIWFSAEGVVIVLDDKTRRDVASLAFNFSPQFAVLQAADNATGLVLDQRSLRRFLKNTMAGASHDLRLLNFSSEIRWTSEKNAGGRVTSQTASFGRDIDEQVTGKDGADCPEEITFDVRVFDDPGLRDTWPIRCAVECMVSEERFRITPLPLELENALEKELTAIEKHLHEDLDGTEDPAAEPCPIFRGSP